MTDKEAIKLTGIENGVPAVAEALDYLSNEVVEKNTPQFDMVDVVKRAQENIDEFWLPAQPLGAPEAHVALETAFQKYLFKKTTMEKFITESEEEMNKVYQAANK